MWEKAYAKILEGIDPTCLPYLLIIGLLVVGITKLWQAWRNDSQRHLASVEEFSDAVAKMREILIVIKDRLRDHHDA